jgi:hypothetical protein
MDLEREGIVIDLVLSPKISSASSGVQALIGCFKIAKRIQYILPHPTFYVLTGYVLKTPVVFGKLLVGV